MPKKCRPMKYAVISADRKSITYGWKCKTHKVPTKRYSTQELRDERINDHVRSAKKSAKKS